MQYFRRVEQKYVLNKDKFDKLIKLIDKYVEKDPYYKSVNSSVYFDSDNNDLIINSIDGDTFKEKVRIRSYGLVKDNDKVYLEIKKKYKGVTYKKRVTMKLKDFWNYYDNKIVPEGSNNLTMKEFDYIFDYYKLKPKMYITYDRYSYLDKKDKNIRITFDYNLKYRNTYLNLDSDKDLNSITDDYIYIMEIKCLDMVPLWMIKILNELKIYPGSISKYKEAYIKGGN